MGESTETVWLVGIEHSHVKTISFETEDGAEEHIEGMDVSASAVETEHVPAGSTPQGHDPDGYMTTRESHVTDFDTLREEAEEHLPEDYPGGSKNSPATGGEEPGGNNV